VRIEIEIPKEFECDYNEDKFKNFFNRVLTDIIFFDGLCGNYEKETAEMLQKAFVKSKVAYDVEAKVAELEASATDDDGLFVSDGNEPMIWKSKAISIVRGKE
jgi:hypothetical protein